MPSLESRRIATVYPTGQRFYIQPDAVGSTWIVTDDTGNLSNLQDKYFPFGWVRPDGIPFDDVAALDSAALVLCGNPNPVFCDGFESGSTGAWDCTVPGNCVEDPTSPLYTGKELESLTGLYDYGARQYDPRIGRFTTPDPGPWQLENPQSFNRYAYALNSPYKYVDPEGEVAVVAIVVGLAAVGFLAAEPANAPSPGDTLLAGSNDNGLGAMAVAAASAFGLEKATGALAAAARAIGLPGFRSTAATALRANVPRAVGVPQKLAKQADHIFGTKNLAKHKLGGMLDSFGGDSIAAFRAVEKGAQNLANSGAIRGTFQTTVKVGEHTVTVRGRVIDGVVNVSTAFVP